MAPIRPPSSPSSIYSVDTKYNNGLVGTGIGMDGTYLTPWLNGTYPTSYTKYNKGLVGTGIGMDGTYLTLAHLAQSILSILNTTKVWLAPALGWMAPISLGWMAPISPTQISTYFTLLK
jgi:hypothetical protein